MYKYLIAILAVICFSCEKENHNKTEFLLKNSCNYAIEVKSSAIVRYSDGYEEKHLTDIVQSGQLLSLRILDVTEDFAINDVFTNIEIYKGTIKSTYNVMDKNNWDNTSSSGEMDTFTITVDSTFFE